MNNKHLLNPLDLRRGIPRIALLLIALAGCSGDAADGPKSPRVQASGKVNFDGQPVPAGTVTFLHLETGNLAICTISDGEYASESDGGPNPGQNAVQIVGLESDEGNPLWGGAWTREVQVGDAGFAEDYSIAKSDVPQYDPNSRPVDE